MATLVLLTCSRRIHGQTEPPMSDDEPHKGEEDKNAAQANPSQRQAEQSLSNAQAGAVNGDAGSDPNLSRKKRRRSRGNYNTGDEEDKRAAHTMIATYVTSLLTLATATITLSATFLQNLYRGEYL